jgi:hypothetical protein
MNPRNDGFDPHRLAIDEAHNLVVTSDFICQLHSLNVVGGDEVILRGTIHVQNFKTRSIAKKIASCCPGRPRCRHRHYQNHGDRAGRGGGLYSNGTNDSQL